MPRKMLILEDDAVLSKHLTRLLVRHGYDVRAEGSVAGFLIAAQEEHFEALLLDLSLPDGDGLDAWKRVKDDQCGTVAILMTAHCSSEVSERASLAGIHALLPKPLDLSALLSEIGPATMPANSHEAPGDICREASIRNERVGSVATTNQQIDH